MVSNEQSVVIPAAEPQGPLAQIRSLAPAYWSANVMELIERWGYYGVRTVLSLYIVDAAARGGLEFTHIQKGAIYAWWALVQSLLPMFTGGFADRFGYKKTIACAMGINIVAYLLMGTQHTYVGFFLACMMLATGTAIFKPGVQGIVANSTEGSKASVGWGIFYAMVNVGGFVGPWSAGFLRAMSWSHVFFASAFMVALNFLMLMTFKEPARAAAAPGAAEDSAIDPDAQPGPFLIAGGVIWLAYTLFSHGSPVVPAVFTAIALVATLYSRAPQAFPAAFKNGVASFGAGFRKLPHAVREPVDILVSSIANAFVPKLTAFLIIFSGFWLMFMQLFDLLPNFIDDWVNTSGILLWLGQTFHNPTWLQMAQNGQQIPPEWMVNIDAGAIVFLMVPIAAIFSRLKALHSIIVGIFVAVLGIVLSGATMVGAWCALGILVFAIGEMMASPKKMEYLASIAPADKKGLYMGYANIPLAIGWGIGSSIGGYMYQTYGDKITLAKRYMATQLNMSPDAIAAIPKEKVMETLATRLSTTPRGVTELLFQMHHPEHLWYIFGAIGIASMLGLIVYDRVLARSAQPAEIAPSV
ncbi:MAG TPA: MFS transporter [Stenomitos sp.]